MPSAWRAVPFIEALRQARARGVQLPEDYYGERLLHLRSESFTVTGLASLAQIRAVLDSLNASLEAGESFGSWRRKVRRGEVSMELPRHRQELVFRNHVQTAYNRGRWAAFAEHAEARPYLMYDAVNDRRTRPAHAAMDGHVAPVDDPIWETWAPQNGHNCRCTLISLSARQAEARGLGGGDTSAQPDRGWEYNPAKAQYEGVVAALARAREELPAALAAATEALAPRAPLDLDGALAAGDEVLGELQDWHRRAWGESRELMEDPAALRAAIVGRMEELGRSGLAAKVQGRGQGARMLAQQAALLPRSWVERANAAGTTHVTARRLRGVHYWISEEMDGRRYRLNGFGVRTVRAGESYIVASTPRTALHEFVHRVQAVLPELDDFFQQLHVRRTAGDALERLRDVTGIHQYRSSEVTRRDHYVEPYMGKEYRQANGEPRPDAGRAGAKELITMTYEMLLSGTLMERQQLLRHDPELVRLALGLLFRYDP